MNIDYIKKFCAGDEDTRDWLKEPFNADDDLVACNGHIMIVLNGASDSLFSETKDGSIYKIIAKARDAETTDAVDVVRTEPRDCPDCEGSGRIHVRECPECEGDGVVDAETDYSTYNDLSCKSCNESGFVKGTDESRDCSLCCGTGIKYLSDLVWINDFPMPIQGHYWDLIKDLPGLRVGCQHEHPLVVFHFDGGVGAVMPVRNQVRPSESQEVKA